MASANSHRLRNSSKYTPFRWVIWGTLLSTIAIWTSINDSFNAPKSWVLQFTGFWLAGWVLFQLRTFLDITIFKWTIIITGLFLLSLSVSFFATDNKYIGLFGEYQRRTGYLTYLCLIIFFLASAFLFTTNQIDKLQRAFVYGGLVVGLYGFAQHFKHDFAKWNNPYNNVISTLGNPDFAAAVMAIFLIISFGVLIQSKHPIWLRILSGLNVVLLYKVIQLSQVRQGLLTSIIGITIILIVVIFQRNKLVALGTGTAASLILLLSVAGMLKIGPLVKYFYKSSVTFRGDYWRAGWRMFIHHPLFGVGLDRYGAYFRQYRDATQELRRGTDLVSNAAHNVPLQLAATGGIFLLVTYLLFTFFTLWRGIVAIHNSSGPEQILAATIFAAWIAYEAQSFISIDNIGIAILGYVLGGSLIGISVKPRPVPVSAVKISYLQPSISIFLAALTLIPSILFFKAESAMYKLQSTSITSSVVNSPAAKDLLAKPLSFGFKEPTFAFIIAEKEANAGQIEKSIRDLKKLISSDPQNYLGKAMLALVYEYQKDWQSAILIRKNIMSIDPFNPGNLLKLGVDEKAIGNLSGARGVIPMIDSFAAGSPESKQAHADFGS